MKNDNESNPIILRSGQLFRPFRAARFGAELFPGRCPGLDYYGLSGLMAAVTSPVRPSCLWSAETMETRISQMLKCSVHHRRVHLGALDGIETFRDDVVA